MRTQSTRETHRQTNGTNEWARTDKKKYHQASRRALQQSMFFRRGNSGHTVPQHCRPHTPHRSALQFMRARSSTPPPCLNAFVSPRLEHRHAVPAAQYRAVQHELCNSGPNVCRQLRNTHICQPRPPPWLTLKMATLVCRSGRS